MSAKKGLADSIRHFTPSWFTVNMGTGAVSILFAGFPYGSQTDAMKALAIAFFCLNLLLFVLFTAASVARYTRYPDLWSLMLRHPTQSLFLGTFPMGAVTLINTAVNVIHGAYGYGGRGYLYAIWGLWWLDVAVSILCTWGIVHVMFTRQDHTLSQMTSVWLLPVVTLIVASSAGGELAQAIHPYSATKALTTLAFSVFMVSIGLTLALMILTIYFYRLVLYGYPQGPGIVSSFVPLGPMGQSGFSIILIGESMQQFLPISGSRSLFLGSERVGESVYAFCICISFLLWALSTMWLGYALLGVVHVVRKTRIPFKLAFWGMIFPNGVYANLTVSLYRVLDVQFFRVWGAIYSIITLLLWIVVFYQTLVMVPRGRIFESPCIEEVNMGKNAPAPETKETRNATLSGPHPEGGREPPSAENNSTRLEIQTVSLPVVFARTVLKRSCSNVSLYLV
ncbi:voltage-dependent anion channel-domain-containing protein [Gloeopeniophorella convolvens]|nr:voltage-dependent anion channel-domain-containing protein [Gloeopeniophorella convolvens]